MAHLLLIDDDLDLIAEQVRQAFPHHRVEAVGTASNGLEQVRVEPPDAILLDLNLPDQSGLEVYDQVRRIDARIPVIFITLAKSADAAIEAMKLGAFDYLFKPLDLHHLRRVVGEAFEVAPADARADRYCRNRAGFGGGRDHRRLDAPLCVRSTRRSAGSRLRTCRC